MSTGGDGVITMIKNLDKFSGLGSGSIVNKEMSTNFLPLVGSTEQPSIFRVSFFDSFAIEGFERFSDFPIDEFSTVRE